MATSMSRASERSARDIFDTKQRAVKFYKDNGVPQKLEDILNSMFYENPPDVYGRLSEYFETLSKTPIISKIVTREILDSKGQPTVQTDIYCIVKGLEKFLGSSTASSYNSLPENAPQEKKEVDDKERQDNINAAIEHIQTHLAPALINRDPCQQQVIDNLILELANTLKQEQDEKQRIEQEKAAAEAEADPSNSSLPSVKETPAKSVSPKGKKKIGSAKSSMVIPEEPKEELLIGCSAVCSMSQAVLMTGAALKKCQPYEYIIGLTSEVVEKYEIPTPMLNVMNSGRAAAGKQNVIKELLLIPKPGTSLKKGLKQMQYVFNQVGKMLTAKQGVSANFVNDMGGYCPTVDKPEQLLDTVQEAITNVGLTAGEDVFFGINCAAHEIFDMDKAKYEVTSGVMKTCDDMIEFYGDLINRYPAIIALIDPLRKHEIEGWGKLCERLSEKCFIIGDYVYPRPERLIQEGFGELHSSAVSLKLQRLTTVSDMLHAAQVAKDEKTLVMISDVAGASSDTILADLAVSIRAKFVKFGAPSRGERVAQYNRLIQISEALEEQDRLTTSEAFNFPVLKPPEPEPEPDNAIQEEDGTSNGQAS
ncbi:enolase 4-like [Amphiura filiformis]|uniref:enolase 4-like n=1 Tax=Amphiura filiformis TaxID=82378 RepID=UPI003B21A66D